MTAEARTRRHGMAYIVSLTGVLIVLGAGFALAAVAFNDRQLWETETVRSGWRLDRHILSRRCRLVDPDGQVKARQSSDRCQSQSWEFPPVVPQGGQDRHLVILLHGLGRSAASFRTMARALRGEGFAAVAVSYPSLKRPLAEHADQIARIIERAEGVEMVSFVTHSLGGIVVRELLSRDEPWAAKAALGRVVMIAPPSRGSALARGLAGFAAFRSIAGPSGLALASDDIARLPAPEAEFGVIVGQAPERRGFNPWLDGNDDGIVRVAETRLTGSHDNLTLYAVHSFIVSDPDAVVATSRFLKTGRFRSDSVH